MSRWRGRGWLTPGTTGTGCRAGLRKTPGPRLLTGQGVEDKSWSRTLMCWTIGSLLDCFPSLSLGCLTRRMTWRFSILEQLETRYHLLSGKDGLLWTEVDGEASFKGCVPPGMVREARDRKMSKSLGNTINPMDVICGITSQDLHKSVNRGNFDLREVELFTHPHLLPQPDLNQPPGLSSPAKPSSTNFQAFPFISTQPGHFTHPHKARWYPRMNALSVSERSCLPPG